MATTDTIFHKRTKWTIATPISGVELDATLNYEFTIERVILVASKKLSGRRRRLGFPVPLSELHRRTHGTLRSFFGKTPVTAILRITGSQKNAERKALGILRDELAILAASQLGWTKRVNTSAPSIVGERPPTRHCLLWLGAQGELIQPSEAFGPLLPLRLDSDWLNFHKKVFYSHLLRLIRQEIKVAKKWRGDLRRAAILIGHSQMANSVPEAFLWNMIALELLLTRQGDNVGDALPSRSEALLGWSRNWREDDFEDKIRTSYEHRCRLVHQWDRECCTREDLYFTDDLLLSLLTNLVRHPELFKSKDDDVRFSEQLEAERLLGVTPKVRPKSLQFLRRKYNSRDYDFY